MIRLRTPRIRSTTVPLLLAAALAALPTGCRSREEPPPRSAPTQGQQASPPATAPLPPVTTQSTQPDPRVQKVKDLFDQGLALAKEGKLIEADALFVQVAELMPGYPSVHWARGMVQAQYGRHDNAISHYLVAIQLNPNFAVARTALGIAYASQGNLSSAIEQFEAVTKIDPKSANAHLLLGRAREQRKQFPEALADYREAVRVDPTFIPGQMALAKLLATRGQSDQAGAALVEAIRLNPKADELFGALGTVLRGQGKPAEAKSRFEQALKIKADNPETLNNYAWFLATYPEGTFRDGARAVTLAKQACELTKDGVPHFLDTLAAAYAEAGQFDEAVKTAERTVAAAEEAGDKDLAWGVRARIQLYKTRRAYHGQKPDAPARKPAPAPATSPATTPPPPAKPE